MTEGSATQEELQRINEEIYKQNAELAVKNKTLSLLRQLYEITTLTLETKELANRLVRSIRATLNFKFVGILVVDKDAKCLLPLAVSFSGKAPERIGASRKDDAGMAIPLSSQDNIYVEALRAKKKQEAEHFSTIVAPFLPKSTIATLQKNSGIQTSLVYPLLIKDKKLGVLLFALRKKAKDLNFFEKESLANLVNVVAVALDKAMLYEALRSSNTRLRKSVLNETRQREELQRAYAKLKELDKTKSEFVSIASHQLRTPLTAIKGYISMILEGTYGNLSAKQKKPVASIYDSNERLIRLVNDLLNVSRIESGRIKIEWQKANLQDVVQSVINEIKIKAKQKKLKLLFEKPKLPLPAFLMDPAKIRNIILNIIDNAIRYTAKGSITVKLSLQKQSKNVLIAIADTGEGMSKQELQRLFESFSRGKAGSKMWTEGAGLGLYIAKQFVQMHKGKIWAESPGKGKGSTFYVELPIA